MSQTGTSRYMVKLNVIHICLFCHCQWIYTAARRLLMQTQGLPGAGPGEAPLRVVRLGPLDAVHESVRSLHLDNLTSRSAREDATLASVKGEQVDAWSSCIMATASPWLIGQSHK